MTTLQELEHSDEFLSRHIGPNDEEIAAMLAAVGQPSLRQKLARLPVLRQRIGAQFALGAFDAAGCSGYASHRLELAGHDARRAFEPGCLARLHQASGGVPRVINALGRHALQHAAQHGLPAAGAASLEAARACVMDTVGAASPVLLGQ